MFWVTRLNQKKLMLNGDMIKCVEETPDTLITLSTGEKIMVKESIGDIQARFLDYKKSCFQGPFTNAP